MSLAISCFESWRYESCKSIAVTALDPDAPDNSTLSVKTGAASIVMGQRWSLHSAASDR